jgi:hypothetical protein
MHCRPEINRFQGRKGAAAPPQGGRQVRNRPAGRARAVIPLAAPSLKPTPARMSVTACYRADSGLAGY